MLFLTTSVSLSVSLILSLPSFSALQFCDFLYSASQISGPEIQPPWTTCAFAWQWYQGITGPVTKPVGAFPQLSYACFATSLGIVSYFQVSKQLFSLHKQNSPGLVRVFSPGTYFLCLTHIGYLLLLMTLRNQVSHFLCVSPDPNSSRPQLRSYSLFAFLLPFSCVEMFTSILFLILAIFFSIFFLSILSKNTVYLDQKEASKPKVTMLSCLQVSFSIYSFHLIHKSQPVIKDSSVLN